MSAALRVLFEIATLLLRGARRLLKSAPEKRLWECLASAVVADIERNPLNLIEALAERIARTCLRVPRVQTVEVTVHKPQAPLPVRVGDVAVSLTRSNHR